jgi:hypothetical protein
LESVLFNRSAGNEVWKIRCKKQYVEANNHLIVGYLLKYSTEYVKVLGRTFHFGKVLTEKSGISIGEFDNRIVPWNNIEIVNILPNDF